MKSITVRNKCWPGSDIHKLNLAEKQDDFGPYLYVRLYYDTGSIDTGFSVKQARVLHNFLGQFLKNKED